MLDDEEYAAFLSVVLAFARATGLSARGLGTVTGVSSSTASRWVRPDGLSTNRPYRHVANDVLRIIGILNRANEKNAVYSGLRFLPAPKRVAELLRVYRAESVC